MVAVEQVIFRSDIFTYSITDDSNISYINVGYFTHVIVDYFSICVATVGLNIAMWQWSVGASSHHSEDGRKPETSCDPS